MDLLEIVVSKLMKIRGIEATYFLSSEDRNEILKREIEAEKQVLAGAARGFNLGLREVLQRAVVIAFMHNDTYEWPANPTVQMMCENELVGEEIKDKKAFNELKAKGKCVMLGDSFAIYTDKLGLMKKATHESLYFLFPPQRMPQMGNIDGISDIILSIPSTPADLYIKEKMEKIGIDISKKRLGTALLGFNVRKGY